MVTKKQNFKKKIVYCFLFTTRTRRYNMKYTTTRKYLEIEDLFFLERLLTPVHSTIKINIELFQRIHCCRHFGLWYWFARSPDITVWSFICGSSKEKASSISILHYCFLYFWSHRFCVTYSVDVLKLLNISMLINYIEPLHRIITYLTSINVNIVLVTK